MTPASSAPSGQVTRAAAPHPRPWPRRAMHVVRRAHLFFGLFMIPWALLYGVTAFLINHPGAFPVEPFSYVESKRDDRGPLVAAPAAASLAAQVTDAWNAKLSAAGSEQRLQLQQPELARYTGEKAYARSTGDGRECNLEIDLVSGLMRMQSRPLHTSGAPFAAADGLPTSQAWTKQVEAELARALREADQPTETVSLNYVPPLVFTVTDTAGQAWAVEHDLRTGAAHPRAANTLPVRQYLLGMHYSARYPSRFGTRWAWAIAVDATAFAFVFWSVSGILMWWQIKATRRWGFVSLAASLLVAGLLAWHMYATLGGGH